MVFPSTRACTRAVQAIEVTPQRSTDSSAAKRSHTFTFCLEHVTQGPYKVNEIGYCLLCQMLNFMVIAMSKSLSTLSANLSSPRMPNMTALPAFDPYQHLLFQGCWMTVGLRIGDYANV